MLPTSQAARYSKAKLCHSGVIAGIVSYLIINFSSRFLDLVYKKLGWPIKGEADLSVAAPDLSLHKAELTTELSSPVDDSASGGSLKRKQSAAVPLANPLEDNSTNSAFYAGVSRAILLNTCHRCKDKFAFYHCCTQWYSVRQYTSRQCMSENCMSCHLICQSIGHAVPCCIDNALPLYIYSAMTPCHHETQAGCLAESLRCETGVYV